MDDVIASEGRIVRCWTGEFMDSCRIKLRQWNYDVLSGKQGGVSFLALDCHDTNPNLYCGVSTPASPLTEAHFWRVFLCL